MYSVVNREIIHLFAFIIIIILLASIYTAEEANNCTLWPSPEQLKGRIILRVILRQRTEHL